MSPTSSGVNKCQYWVKEPEVCGNWDDTIIICTEEEADYYPFCNLIGTQTKCNKYDGDKFNLNWRCVRPDRNRTVENRYGDKWVELPKLDVNGNIVEAGNYDNITGYNDGNCDGHGTNIKCSGYMPFHMGFSELEPDDSKSTLGYDKDGKFTTLSGLTFRLPLSFDVYNLRSKLGRCYWWKNNSIEFYVTDSGTTTISGFYCANQDEITKTFNKFQYNHELNMFIPPCNGAKPECPYYTSICWEYCIDEYIKPGDFILAEQIMELRYYLRKDKWTQEYYEESFYEPVLYAWEGSIRLDTVNIEKSLIPAIKVEFENFDTFKLNRESIVLGAGLAADDHLPPYPTLVRELKDISLAPVIRNQFDSIDDKFIFETSDLDHSTNLIFGDIFYYDSDTYAFNINDPELNIPSDIKYLLLNYESMDDIELALDDRFDEFYNRFSNLIQYYLTNFSEHIPESYLGRFENMFFINVPTFFGENNVVVINNGNGRWEFDTINFTKTFVGGVIGQLSFSVKGDGIVNYLPSYEDGFRANKNDNGTINFKFFPLTADIDEYYTYIDGVKKRLSSNYLDQTKEIVKLNYKLYKRKLYSNLELEIGTDVKFFGNSGYALVSIPDDNNELIDLFKHWEAENIRLVYSENDYVDMEVVVQDSSKIELNQMIIKPKNIIQFSSVCSWEAKLYIENIFIYERRNINDNLSSEYEEINEFFIANDSIIEFSEVELNKQDGGVYSITKFDDMPLAPAVIFKGKTGRIRGQAKTKLITWVRQPFCRDVEIFYSWNAKYRKYKLLPEFKKYGPTGVHVYTELYTKSYTPPCGDHDLSFLTQLGPLWYPYDKCDDVAYYNIRSTIIGTDDGVMEVFLKDYGADPPHGQHDMRMLGPADNFGEICGIHSTIWNCSEDWSYCNYEKVGENYFIGYARYRGGLSYEDKVRAIQFGGSLPKFGNTYRDFLRSFRAYDNIDYYYWNGTTYMRRNKWVPYPELYSIVDYTSVFEDFPYKMYISNDFYDDKSLFLDQFAMLLVDSIEDININETIVADENGLIRFDFDDIFRVHDITGIYYPEPKVLYLKGTNLIPIISWYTYKDNPLGDLDKSIQWVWREPWKELERFSVSGQPNFINFTYLNGHPTYNDDNTLKNILSGTYIATSSGILGKHKFLNIEYPPYKYDFRLKEHRLVCDEGEHTLKLTPPPSSGTLSEAIFKLQLNDGPTRCFDLDGNWVTKSGCNDELYSTCTQNPWVTEVTLFDTGYTSQTPSEDRTIITYDDTGNEVETYYQRGLHVEVNKDYLNLFLPYKYKILDIDDYELRFNKNPVQDSDGSWVSISNLNLYYPGINYLGVVFNSDQENVIIDIKPTRKTGIFAIGIDYEYGSVRENEVYNLFNVPGLIINKFSIDNVKTEVLNIDNLILSDKNDELGVIKAFYKCDADIKELFTGIDHISLNFRLKASADELNDYGYNKDYYDLPNINTFIKIKNLYVYTVELVEAVEPVKTYERKYYISLGKHGDFPPHGYNSTGSLLYKLPGDPSTVYQMDTLAGVVGMPGSNGDFATINKVRGRLIYKCHSDKEAVKGLKDVSYYEDEQKKIHDAIALAGNTSFSMVSYPPPGFEDKLVELGINVSFPRWTCTFENTLVRPLAAVNKFSKYSPCGHHFIYDFEHMRNEPCIMCGIYLPVPCVWYDIYNRVFERACQFKGSSYSKVPNWAVVAYFQGIANVLIRPFEYFVQPSLEYYEMASTNLKSWIGDITMDFPSSPISLY